MSTASRPFRDEELRDIARAFVYPPTPDIAGAVARRLAARPPRALRASDQSVLARRVWIALALLLALLVTTIFAVPEARALFQRFFQLGAIQIVRPTPTPTPVIPPSPTPTLVPGTPTAPPPTPTPVPTWNPGLVGETTLADVRQTVSFPIRLPAYPPDIGPPDRVFVQHRLASAVILAWMQPGHPDQPRMLLYTMRVDVMGEKTVPDTTIIRETAVHGQRALWVQGPHVWAFYDARGDEILEPRRLVTGNVLVWQEHDLTYRLESVLTLDEAVRVAESLR